MNKSQPNYNKIYTDILNKKYPHRKEEFQNILQKEILSAIDIIELNKRIFGQRANGTKENQKYRSYSESDILCILNYQKKNGLNNTQVAKHFQLSRNTVAKWIKYFKQNQ